jgi:phosphatidylglycerol:prolipoprotein diacylglycerol transferase
LHPELFRFQIPFLHYERPVQSYGALIIVGMTVAMLVGARRARAYGVAASDVIHVGFLAIAGGIVGAAALFILVHLPEFIADPSLLKQPGLVFYGGLAGGIGSAYWYCRHFRVPFARVADAGVPALAFGHAFGRVGCLLGGCCYGREISPDHPFAIVLHGTTRHPVQAYEAVGLVVLGAILVALSSRLRARPGALAWLYIALYAVLRFAMELFRGDDVERGRLAGLISTSQIIALVAFAVAAVAFARRRRAEAPSSSF